MPFFSLPICSGLENQKTQYYQGILLAAVHPVLGVHEL